MEILRAIVHIKESTKSLLKAELVHDSPKDAIDKVYNIKEGLLMLRVLEICQETELKHITSRESRFSKRLRVLVVVPFMRQEICYM